MDLTWSAMGVIVAAGSAVVGWVWATARENRTTHDRIQREFHKALDEECKALRAALAEQDKALRAALAERDKALRDDMQDSMAEQRLEHNQLANAQQKFEVLVANEYVKADILGRLESKLDKLSDKIDDLKDDLYQSELRKQA